MIIPYLHKMSANSSGVARIVWQLLRKLVIWLFNDPKSKTTINEISLALPLSHQLPIYMAKYPEYDKLPGRIHRALSTESNSICFIDIGANVGDTIAQFKPNADDFIIAVEPNESFNSYLHFNFGKSPNLQIIDSICSSIAEEKTVVFEAKNGTASLKNDGDASKITTTTVDLIVSQKIVGRKVDLLKIDTDGFDFDILRGAANTIKENSPAVLFECDIFNNPNYVSDINEILNLFEKCGYDEFLVYDNFGYLMGKYSVFDRKWFMQLLHYQCSSNFYYFDILFMHNGHLKTFYNAELTRQTSIAKSESRINSLRKIEKVLNEHSV